MPLKTPLDDRFTSQMASKHLFTPSMFLDSFRSSSQRIGLWINLAFTDRFYDKDEIEKRNIKYVKLSCRGHGETPTDAQVKTFIKICNDFVKDHPDDLIAVHCTHGFNRTGFLIAAYCVEEHDSDILAVVTEFARKRPPGIYKKDYLEELFKRYGDMDDCPPPPELPDWCYEEPETADDAGDDESDGTPRRKEFTKKDPTFMSGVGGVTAIVDEKELSRIRIKVQRMVGTNLRGFPGAQPVSMTRSNIQLLSVMKYMVSWKADGTRYMLLIEDREKMYFIDRDNSVFQIHGLTFPSPSNYRDDHITDTLCDGEMVLDADPNRPGSLIPRFLIYDIIVISGKEMIRNKDFETRFKAIKEQVIVGRDRAIVDKVLNRGSEPFGVRRKDFFDLSVTEKVMNMKTGHDHDGLIFQPVPEPYTGGTCPKILKWKPPHLNSVDFKCRIEKINAAGCLPETNAMMYVLGDRPNSLVLYGKTKLTKSKLNTYRDYDGKIVECTHSLTHTGEDQWDVMRIRTDKSHPNSYRTAVAVCDSIKHPVTKDFVLDLVRQLCQGQMTQAKRKGEMPPPPGLPKHAKI